MSRTGPVLKIVADVETGSHPKKGVPGGFILRLPAYSNVKRGMQVLRKNNCIVPRQTSLQGTAGCGE